MTEKPIVTLDLSWLVGTRPRQLPNQCIYLVPDAIFSEIAGADEPAKRIRCLLRWLRLNQDRIYFGHSWDKIAKREIRLDSPVSYLEIVNQAETSRLYKQVFAAENADWLGAITGTRSTTKHSEYEDKRQFFLRIVRILERTGPDHIARVGNHGLPAHTDAMRTLIQNEDLAWSFASNHLQGYIRLDWESRMRVFPDHFATGRIARVFACIFLLASTGHTKGIANSWDDAQYAFLATYSKAIYTKDGNPGTLRGLAGIVSLISPETEIISE